MAALSWFEAYWLIQQVLQVTINATILILVGVDGEKRLVAAAAAATFVEEEEVDYSSTAL